MEFKLTEKKPGNWDQMMFDLQAEDQLHGEMLKKLQEQKQKEAEIKHQKHLAHLKSAYVTRGLTVVTFLTRPSTATSLPRWSALRFLISTLASLGRLNSLTLIPCPGRSMLGTRSMTAFLAISRHLSGSSRRQDANVISYMLTSS